MLCEGECKAGKKWQKRRNQRALLGLLDEYFAGMRETSVLVDPIILSCLGESEGRIAKSGEIYARLHEAALGRLGKPKMRSYVARIGYELMGGRDLQKFLPLAAAMDLLEFSYYCSDAIFDTDIYDRDREIVKDKIIVSHILTSCAFKLAKDAMDGLGLDAKRVSGISSGMYRFTRDIYEGFFIENHNGEPSRDVYERRTYAYNYWEHILGMAAIAAGGDDEEIAALSNFGKYNGMAYMVANDIADIVKDFEDIRNGRYTLPNIIFMEKANGREKESFMKMFGNKNADKDGLRKIGQMMVDLKVIDDCLLYASSLVERALPHLGTFGHSRQKVMLAVATRAVYNNRWYRDMARMYGYRRAVAPCGLELAGITGIP